MMFERALLYMYGLREEWHHHLIRLSPSFFHNDKTTKIPCIHLVTLQVFLPYRSLNRPTTSRWLSVRNLAWTSIVMVTSCLREVRVRRSMMMTPPPSTVSTVRASRLGVSASKSCKYPSRRYTVLPSGM